MVSCTYYAMVLQEACSDEAAKYILDMLVLDWEEGGADLQVAKQPTNQHLEETVIHITANNHHIVKIAEILKIKKADKDGFIRPVTVEEIDEFPTSGRVGPLTLADVQRCVIHAMERLHFPLHLEDRLESLLGHPSPSIVPGSTILDTYKERDLIEVFPVHDDEDLDKIYKSWSMTKSPLEEIRNYFGEGAALYFSFLSHYTKFLILIAAFGMAEFILKSFFSVDHVTTSVIFSFVNLIVVGVFLETWKRRSNCHSFYWGTRAKLRHKLPRPQYRGEIRHNPVTGGEEVFYLPRKTLLKLYLVSTPITLACLVLASWNMFNYFWINDLMLDYLRNPDTGNIRDDTAVVILAKVPKVSYALLIKVVNGYYKSLAKKLTDWENHRTQDQYDKHLVSKIVVFKFVNTFLVLFYTAFWLQDLTLVRSYLLTALVVNQVVNQIQEVVIPIFLHKPVSQRLLEKVTRKLSSTWQQPTVRDLGNIEELHEDETRAAMVQHDLIKDPLESLRGDFMEMWLQFGYVSLFMTVFPLAALFALLNNCLEAFVDIYKMCKLSRKPRPVASQDIGAWFSAFHLTTVVAIMTNCALLAIDLKETAGQGWGNMEWFGMFVLIENLFMLAFVIVDQAIPDVPSHLKVAMDKMDYHFKEKAIKIFPS